jgi:hypothetical protein
LDRNRVRSYSVFVSISPRLRLPRFVPCVTHAVRRLVPIRTVELCPFIAPRARW